jgi:hypothetical protein
MAVTEALILRLSKLKLRPWPRRAHEAVTVGNDKQPLTPVSCSNIASAEHSPSRIHPHFGKVSKHDVESSSNESCRVLHERIARLHFANDPGHFHPKATTVSVEAGFRAGLTDVLTGKSARNHVNTSSPICSGEGAYVVPDREEIERTITLSELED